MTEHRFEATLWKSNASAPWHFVTLPPELADDIEAAAEPKAFGSIRVRAAIGETTWETSVFPAKEADSYILPIKRSVRDAESIGTGDTISIGLVLAESGPDRS